MKTTTFVSIVLLASLLAGESAFAQRYNRHEREARERWDQSRRWEGTDPRLTRSGIGPLQVAAPGEGAGPARDVHLGDRFPRRYFNRNYVVDDWAAHGLSQPAGGCQWFQLGADYVQVQMANGYVAMVLVAR